jgi:hypothetical protein
MRASTSGDLTSGGIIFLDLRGSYDNRMTKRFSRVNTFLGVVRRGVGMGGAACVAPPAQICSRSIRPGAE